MEADDVGDFLIRREVREHLGPLLGMLPDVLPLALVQRVGLAQDGVRDPDLAEVVEQAGEVQRLRLFFGQLERRSHIPTVHGDGGGVLGRVLVLAVQQDDHGRCQADVHLQILVAELSLPSDVLPLANEELEHVLGGEQRDEEKRDGDDAGSCIQGGDGEPQEQEDAERAQERGHLLSPEGAEGAPVLDTHPNAQESEVRRLEGDSSHGTGEQQGDGHLVEIDLQYAQQGIECERREEDGHHEVRRVVDHHRSGVLAPGAPQAHSDRHANGRQPPGEHDRQEYGQIAGSKGDAISRSRPTSHRR